LQQIKALALRNLPALVLRDVNREIWPSRRWEVRVVGRLQDLHRIEIEQERAAGALARSIDAHDAIYVLGRRHDRNEAVWPESVDEQIFDCLFSWKIPVLVQTAEARAFHQHGGYASGRIT